MPVKRTEWENGRTDQSGVHDLILPFEEYFSLLQIRHYFFLSIPVTTLPPGGRVTRGFKFQLFEGTNKVFELEYELTLTITAFVAGMFGQPILSLLSYAVAKERFRTTMVEGQETAPVDVINSQTTSGRIQDYTGKDLTDAEVSRLVNPSWTHTLGGNRNTEFGTVILDARGGLGTDTAIIEGRIELPYYYQTVGPGTKLDIVTEAMATAGRADLYQFRAAGTPTPNDISAMEDIFGSRFIATLYSTRGTQVIYEDPLRSESRGVISTITSPSIVESPGHLIKVVGLDNEAKKLEIHTSRNGGHSFRESATETIMAGSVTMPQAITLNDGTGETGVVFFEGTQLVFRRSGDNWAGKTIIAEFKKPTPMALSCSKSGILRVQNGKGLLWENRRGGSGPWTNLSRIPVP